MQVVDIIQRARPRRLSRAEYDRLIEHGFFRDERLELIRGMLIEMAPIGPSHANPVDRLNEIFVRGLAGRARVRIQQPFVCSDDSEPQPDIALVAPRDYIDAHPSEAFLIIEVAESSLEHDRDTKAPLYCSSGVSEYWIVDVAGATIEVHDRPEGETYHRVRLFGLDEEVAPAAFPDVRLRVSDVIRKGGS